MHELFAELAHPCDRHACVGTDGKDFYMNPIAGQEHEDGRIRAERTFLEWP